MAELKLPQSCIDQIDKFYANTVDMDVNRTKYLKIVLRDPGNKLTICLIYDCQHHEDRTPEFFTVEGKGCTIILPAFWVLVPKELAIPYIIELINNDFYTEEVTKWDGFGSVNIGGTLGGGVTGYPSYNGTAAPPCYAPNTGTGCPAYPR